jgi:hypothetical protein
MSVSVGKRRQTYSGFPLVMANQRREYDPSFFISTQTPLGERCFSLLFAELSHSEL